MAGAKALVEDFFANNYRDITSRETIEWGQPVKQENGNVSIRYKYNATIWDKNKIIENKIFTFDKVGKFVSVKNVKGYPQKLDNASLGIETNDGFKETFEETLPAAKGRNAKLLDIDTGKWATKSDFGENDRETHKWVRDNGLDLLGIFEKEQFDIVSICIWPGLYAEMTVAAAEHGVKAIFCEKPMAVNLGEADRMIDACNQNGAMLLISHQLRFNPHIHKAKQLVETGAIGEPRLAWGHYETSLLNKGTHVVDAMRYILGDPKTDWVLGQIERKKDSYNRGHRVEEIAEALIQFSNGTRGLLETGDLAISEFGCHIYGSEGQLDVALNRLLIQSKEHKGW